MVTSTTISAYGLHTLNHPPTKTALPYSTANVLKSIYFQKQVFLSIFYIILLQQRIFTANFFI